MKKVKKTPAKNARKTARKVVIQSSAMRKGHTHLSLSEILILRTMISRPHGGKSLLPAKEYTTLMRKIAVCEICKEQSSQIRELQTAEKRNNHLMLPAPSPKGFTNRPQFLKLIPRKRYLIPAAAVFLFTISVIFTNINRDSDKIELIYTNNAINNGNVTAGENPIGVKFLQRKKKIGEIKVHSQSHMRLVKVTGKKNKFQSTIKMHGGEADILLNRNLPGSIHIQAGELSAHVQWRKANSEIQPKGGAFGDPFVHLRISDVKETNEDEEKIRNLSIEVLRGKIELDQPDIPGEVTDLEPGEFATITLEPG